MRALLFLAFVFSTAVANAQWVKVEDPQLHVNAVRESVYSRNNWVCAGTRLVNGKPGTPIDEADLMVGNWMNWLIYGVNAWVRTDLQQPLIYFTRGVGSGTMYVTTDESRRVVTQLSYYRKQERKEKRNVGTIDKPIYQDVVIETTVVNINCK